MLLGTVQVLVMSNLASRDPRIGGRSSRRGKVSNCANLRFAYGTNHSGVPRQLSRAVLAVVPTSSGNMGSAEAGESGVNELGHRVAVSDGRIRIAGRSEALEDGFL